MRFSTLKASKMKRAIFAAAAFAVASSCVAAGNRKAIVFMFDGFRADALENADAPNMKMLMDGKWQSGYNGAYSLCAETIPDAPTISGPNHVSIACGVTSAKTGVTGNGANRCDFAKWPSWLVRLVEAQPGRKALFAFEWPWDKTVSPHPSVEFFNGLDAENGAEVAKRLAGADAPDAVMFYINAPDYAGHTTGGFYPFNQEYLGAVHVADGIVGQCLAAIASRTSFRDEDWLVAVVSDHGGFGKGHTDVASHGSTIPLVFAGRHVAQGMMPGAPRNYDIAPTVLAHFGIDAAPFGLDGKIAGDAAAADSPRPLKDGLVAYLPFDGGEKGGVVGECFRVSGKNPSGLRIEGSQDMEFEDGECFAFAAWVKIDAGQKGDPLLVGNKDWRTGSNPGVAVTVAKAIGRIKTPGVCLNSGADNERKRVDVGVFTPEYGKWTFYAATRSKDGVLTFYQGTSDGWLYALAGSGAGKPATGLPFFLGQDGTGAYKHAFAGCFDEFALWGRALSRSEVRMVFEAGRRGVEMRELIDPQIPSLAGRRKQ